MIDSLDQLTDENGARRFLEWLPRRIPAHVHLIVSTLPDVGGCFERLKTFELPDENLVKVIETIQMCIINIVISYHDYCLHMSRDFIPFRGLYRNITIIYVQRPDFAVAVYSERIFYRLILETGILRLQL